MRSIFDAQRGQPAHPENPTPFGQDNEAENWRLVERDLQENETLWPLQTQERII